MTHAEKSDALFDKIYKELDGYGILPPGHMKAMSKDLSIICVEQIVHAVGVIEDQVFEWDRRPYEDFKYWQEVLSHIKNS